MVQLYCWPLASVMTVLRKAAPSGNTSAALISAEHSRKAVQDRSQQPGQLHELFVDRLVFLIEFCNCLSWVSAAVTCTMGNEVQ